MATMLVHSAVITKQQVATTIVHAMMAVQQVAQVCLHSIFAQKFPRRKPHEIYDTRNIARY